jgi:hypothetical protein
MLPPVAPFFIVGCARSGTTLLRRLVNNHSDVAIPLESLFLLDYLKVGGRFAISDLIPLLVREPQMLEWGIAPRIADFSDCATLPEVIAELHRIYARQHGKKHWGQKTPRFIRNLDLIQDSFPNARFIHIVRDPRAVANSLIRSNVHRSTAYHAAKRWAGDVAAGLDFQDRYPDKALMVSYEGLVADQQVTLQQITDFVGIDYQPNMLQPDMEILKEYSRFNAKIQANLGRAVTAELAGKWVGELSGADLKIVESICSPLMNDLGYARRCLDVPGAAAVLTARARRIPGVIMQTYQYLRFRPGYTVYLLWRKWRLGLLGGFWGDINQ